ncbi:MAG: hypothetical protein ABMA00_11705 [Gemmatimonas sp.]
MTIVRNSRPVRQARRLAILTWLTLALFTPALGAAQQASLPTRLTDAEYWKLLTDISEPGGYFRITDNYTSNEPEIGRLYSMLRERGTTGGVYIGVGPEQNLTYIAAIRPQMAFVIDIRRQAVVQHLMYKAIFEMATDRADFVSILFGKPRPIGIGPDAPIQTIWDAYVRVRSDSALAARHFESIRTRLVTTHGFALDANEAEQLRTVYWAFFYWGPAITTRGAPGGRGGGNGSSFADLTGYSTDDSGVPRSFLATAEDYITVKNLHERNLIVPVSGDFAGPKALRAIGAWLTERSATVRAFYLSNVEQYLFQDGKQQTFYDNAATLPVDAASVFIRPYAFRRGAVVESLCPISPFLVSAKAGRVQGNNDALGCVR